MARTILPMISATDPYISGQMALVNPNEILNTVENSYSYYDISLKGKNSEIYFGDLASTVDGLDDIIESVNNNNESHVLDFKAFEEFVESIQADYSEYLSPSKTTFVPSKQMEIVLPESPISMEDNIFSLSDYQSLESFEIFSDGTESLLDETLSNANNEFLTGSDTSESLWTNETLPSVDNTFETTSDGNESFLDESVPSVDNPIELPAETSVEVNECLPSKVYKSRYGRVNKRKLYENDDEDYKPDAKKAKKRSSKKISKPRVRIYDEATKHQNMIAARRYREKKRVQQASLDDIYDEELEKNTKLYKEIEQLQTEIGILKELLSSFLKPHTIVRI